MTTTLERPSVLLDTPRRGLQFSPLALRVVLCVIVALQAVKSGTVPNSVYAKSQWFVDYRYGFVRRGLGGQLTGQSDLAVDVALIVCWALPVFALLVVLELLVRRWTPSSTALAILIACSPLVVNDAVYYRRTDQLGLVIVVLIGLACLTLRRWLLPSVAALGLALAGIAFMHEASLLIWGLAAVPIVFVTGHRSWWRNVHLCIAAVVPALTAVLIIAIAGSVSPEVAAALRHDAALPGPTVFRYLSQGILDSVGEVYYVGISKHLAQLTMGALMIAAHILWFHRLIATKWLRQLTRLDRRTRAVLGLLMSSAVVTVFATGIDWMRWFSGFTTVALVIIAFAMLACTERPMSGPSMHLSWGFIAIMGYLAILTPTPEIDPNIPVPDIGALYRLLDIVFA